MVRAWRVQPFSAHAMRLGINIVSVLIILQMLTVLLWVIDPRPPQVWYDNEVLNPGPLRPGDLLVVRRHFCQRLTPTAMHRTIIDAAGSTYPMIELGVGQTGAGLPCPTSIVYSVQLPNYLPPGKYIYRVNVVHELNPLRTITLQAPDVAFEIVGKDG